MFKTLILQRLMRKVTGGSSKRPLSLRAIRRAYEAVLMVERKHVTQGLGYGPIEIRAGMFVFWHGTIQQRWSGIESGSRRVVDRTRNELARLRIQVAFVPDGRDVAVGFSHGLERRLF